MNFNFFRSKKGFFFTFSVILFVSTLVFLTQGFSTKNVLEERYIISSYRPSVISFISDDIAFDLKKILGFETDLSFNDTNVNIYLSDSISREVYLIDLINNYSDFLSEIYFKRTQGSKIINFSSAKDGNYEIFYGSDFIYYNNYDTNSIKFISNNNKLNIVDLNIYFKKPLINYSWVPNKTGVLSEIKIIYFGDYNYFEIIDEFNPLESSSLVLEFDEGVVDINFGLVDSKYSSLFIDSKIKSKIDFTFNNNYDFDKNELPINFNSVFSIILPDVESSSLINLRK